MPGARPSTPSSRRRHLAQPPLLRLRRLLGPGRHAVELPRPARHGSGTRRARLWSTRSRRNCATPAPTAASSTASCSKTASSSTKPLRRSSRLAEYVQPTNDDAFLRAHRDGRPLRCATGCSRAMTPRPASIPRCRIRRTSSRCCPSSPMTTPSTWRAMLGLGDSLHAPQRHRRARRNDATRATALHAAILAHGVSATLPAPTDRSLPRATDGKRFVFTEIPPGSLMKLAGSGLCLRGRPGLCPHLPLAPFEELPVLVFRPALRPAGELSPAVHHLLDRRRPLRCLRAGEQGAQDPARQRLGRRHHHRGSGRRHRASWTMQGRAFATAAGYVAHAICESACTDRAKGPLTPGTQIE